MRHLGEMYVMLENPGQWIFLDFKSLASGEGILVSLYVFSKNYR